MSETPEFIGQVYTDTNTGNIWKSNSLTPGDWTLDVQDAQFMWDSQSVNLFALAELVISGPIPGVTSFTVNMPTQGGGITISNSPSLQTISFPITTSVDPTTNNTGTLKIINNINLTTINLPALTAVGWQLYIDGNQALTSIDLSSFITCDGGLLINGGSLVNLSLPVWLPSNGSDNYFLGNLLNAASVNGILARGVANAGFVSGSIHLDQGANAAPTGQGIADKATLIGRGVSVTTN